MSNSFKTICFGNSKSYCPDNFKRILGKYNNKLRYYEVNDSKELISFILGKTYDELNYSSDNPIPNFDRSNQYERTNSLIFFKWV